ncbi:hypothetical protein [Roseateles sp. P5_E11]
MAAPVYVIKTLTDLLKVPADRRRALFDEIEMGLLVYELAWGDGDPDSHEPMEFTWTDDDCRDTTLLNPDGSPVLHVQITKTTEPA